MPTRRQRLALLAAAAVTVGAVAVPHQPDQAPAPDSGRSESCVTSPAGLTPNGPVTTPITGRYLLTSNYGPRWGAAHNGIDLAAPTNVPTLAAAAGTVTFAGWAGGAGNMIRIDHGGGIETVYMHHSRIDVRVGTAVKAGQPIGVQGTTGDSTGPHLHFEVHINGAPVEPRAWLAKAGVTIPPEGQWGEGAARTGPAAAVTDGAPPAPPVCDTTKAGVNSAGIPNGWGVWVAKAGTLCPEYPAAVVAAQIEVESGWDPDAVSPAGATGLSQFMPATWAGIGRDDDSNGRVDPRDPGDAIMAQGRYGCQMVTLLRGKVAGDVLDNALAAYNAGAGAVLTYGGIPPYPETQAYVPKIRSLAKKYETTP